jgi:hypothetical protein
MRFVLEIDNRAIAILDAPSTDRAVALIRSEYFGDVLKDTLSGGVPLWNGHALQSIRPPTYQEEQKWQAEHSRNNTELGLSDDQGMCVWLVPIDDLEELPPQFSCKDEWGFW